MMSHESALNTIEIVKRKLKKYTALKEHGKVREYLRRLHHLSLSPTLIQETRLERLVRKLASHKTENYSSTARHLLKRWHHQRSTIPTPTTTIDVNKTLLEKKSDDHVMNPVKISSESPSSDDHKKRRVLSLAQYLESKKDVLSPSSTLDLTQKKLTDTQIEVINAQFQATTEKLTATAPNLTQQRIEIDKPNNHPILKKSIVESKSKFNDLWAEDDDSVSNSE